MKVLEDVDRAQESKTAIAKRHGIPKCTLSRILKDREKLEKAYNSGAFTPGRKRMRLADHEDLEKALFLWFKRARSSNLPVTGPILEEKARDIALQMGIEDFKFSDGWLSRFKKRHGLVFRTIAGFLEQVDASQEGSDASQEESDADNAEAHTVFDLVAQRCGSGTGTMDEYEAVDDDVVTCREDTLADILKEVEEGTGDESEEEMESDDHQSAPLTSEASQAVDLLQRDGLRERLSPSVFREEPGRGRRTTSADEWRGRLGQSVYDSPSDRRPTQETLSGWLTMKTNLK
ncbi:hypothetical protein HPB50_020280 [Hyalomma asiaticum]|uniref:Uncharacterized protein n=1 Tax=Hyalomma asiaticum TaxID=266040 RepID=A0ACB7RMP0_HYAAI|nr:hypothetical protein HPB50_020280 [Hyalomma asiaticum]